MKMIIHEGGKMIIHDGNRTAATILKGTPPQVLLVGPSGCGKTYLTRELARDGDVVVDLQPYTDRHAATQREALIDALHEYDSGQAKRLIVTSPVLPLLLEGMDDDRLLARLASMATVRMYAWTTPALYELLATTAIPDRLWTQLAEQASTPGEVVGYDTLWRACDDEAEAERQVLRVRPRMMRADAGPLIIAETARAYGVSEDDILGARRLSWIVVARHAAMAAMRQRTDLGVTEIGELLRKDHSTVCFGAARNARRVETNSAARRAWQELNNRLDAVMGRDE
jgi:hypothetical protein